MTAAAKCSAPWPAACGFRSHLKLRVARLTKPRRSQTSAEVILISQVGRALDCAAWSTHPYSISIIVLARNRAQEIQLDRGRDYRSFSQAAFGPTVGQIDLSLRKDSILVKVRNSACLALVLSYSKVVRRTTSVSPNDGTAQSFKRGAI
jgi:hypothetical protein